jgi:phage terminase small subunit
MKTQDLISVTRLCSLYEIEVSFVSHLRELGLIQLTSIEESYFVHRDYIEDVERMMRLHRDLDVNPEGIDVIFNLLHKVDHLHNEVNELRNRLRLYEGE